MLLYIHRCAGVSEWQTMWTQNPLVVIPCGFDPHHRHKNPQPQGWGFLLVAGVEQSGGGNTANKAPVGLCLARGCHRIGSSTGAEAVDGLRFSSAARLGGFCRWRGSNRAAVSSTANKAPVRLCLARGCHRMGSSIGAEAVDGLRFSPAARLGVFCWWRGSNRAAVSSTAPALRR